MNSEMNKVLAIVTLVGFAIQQAIQLFDVVISQFIQDLKANRAKAGKPLPGGLSDTEFKKVVISWISLILGIVAVLCTGIRTLKYVGLGGTEWSLNDWGDAAVTSLIVGAGTEGMNTLLKYFGYVKDARGAMTSGDITIIPAALSIKVGATFQLLYKVTNPDNSLVVWSVPQGAAGGTITQTGLYTAPSLPVTCQVMVTSQADPTKSATATIAVTS